MITIYQHRRERLMSSAASLGADALLVSKKENIYYLTGLASVHPLEREAFLLIKPGASILYHSPFVIPPTQNNLVTSAMSASNTLSDMLTKNYSDCHMFAIEKLNLTVAELERLQTILPNREFISTDALINDMRTVKDNTEITHIKNACDIATKTYKWVHNFINRKSTLGITEAELAAHIESQMKQFGSHRPAFPTIVAFDEHSASPHHIPTTTKLHNKSIVLIDFGATIHGYLSDVTRTWHLGTPSPQFSKIEQVVVSAYQSSFDLVASSSTGLIAAAVDEAARSIIDKAGYGEKFIHTTGHGIGLEAHEAPSLNSANDQPIKPNTVITIEPGIYLPGQFGYRYENTVLIADKSALELT